MAESPVIIAVGGGKGGVGKSLISSGIATALALNGRSTACVDLDLGGANLHTFFGFRNAETGIGDFVFKKGAKDLSKYSLDCHVKNLVLIPGSGFIPGIANLYYFQKLKILRALKRLDFDFVVLDLGAGTSYNVIDFFSITRSGIVVTNPEPTAILNAYEFIKNVLFRIFSRAFKQGHIALEIIEAHKFGENQEQGTSVRDLVEQLEQVDAHAAKKVISICKEFTPYLVLNMVRSERHSSAIASNLMDICKNFLDISLKYLGSVPRHDRVSRELVKLKNVMLSKPESPAAKAISELATRCLTGFSTIDVPFEESAEKDDFRHEKQNGLKTGRSEKEDLASLLERFFLVLEKDEAHSKEGEKAFSPEEVSALSILDPRPQMEEQELTPIFERDVELALDNFEVPSNLRQLLAFISELTHLEDAIKQGKSSQLAVSEDELADAWFKTGLMLAEAGQFSSALRSFKRATGLKKAFAEARLNSACCLILLGEIEEAVKLLSKLKKNDKGEKTSIFHQTVFNLSLAFFLLGEYENVIETLSLIKESPSFQDRCTNMEAFSRFFLGQLKEAADLWQRSNKDFSAFNMAVALSLLGKYQGAISALDSFLKANKNHPAANALMSVCLFNLEKKEDAFGYLERAIGVEPFNVRFRSLMAFYAFKTGRMDRAFKEADLIAKLRPSNQDLLDLVTEIRHGLGSH